MHVAPCGLQAALNSMAGPPLTAWRGSPHAGAQRTAFLLPAPGTPCRLVSMAAPAIQTAPTWARSLRHTELHEVDDLPAKSAFSPHQQRVLESPEQPTARQRDLFLESDAPPGAQNWDRSSLAQPAASVQRQDVYPGVVEGTVQRITFRAADSGFAVLKVSMTKQQGLSAEQHLNLSRRQTAAQRDGRRRQQAPPGIITVTGIFPDVSTGQVLRCEGHWVDHTTHGHQLQSMRCIRSERSGRNWAIA